MKAPAYTGEPWAGLYLLAPLAVNDHDSSAMSYRPSNSAVDR